ncbi:MAG: hypothetical protein K2O06_04110 [Acetatifactor sp.]|nr:hypothetical protein [Acetatifactor sp.]
MIDRLMVLKHYIYYKYIRTFRSRRALECWQRKKISAHLKYVAAHSPLYRGKISLEEYPVIDKAYMMKHFDRLNTAGIRRKDAAALAVKAEKDRDFSPKLQISPGPHTLKSPGKLRNPQFLRSPRLPQRKTGITVGLSSGTSGLQGLFLVSDREKNQWAGYILARFLDRGIMGSYDTAFFMRADSNLYQAVSSKNIRFHFFDIYRSMEEHIKRLNRLKPQILAGQPSVLLLLAEKKRRGELEIHPRTIISIAEVLEKEDERRLKEAFELPVIHQVYQCTEGCLASTCPRGTLHLHENIVHIDREYLDKRRFIPVITDFERRTQPIIRYRLNDILVEKGTPCPCGSPFLALKKIEGREDDMFSFSGIDGQEKRVFPDFIRRCILFAADEVIPSKWTGEYRVVQEMDGNITVYADFKEQQKQRVLKEFTVLARDQKFILPKVRFAPYLQEQGRKMKRIERKVPHR